MLILMYRCILIRHHTYARCIYIFHAFLRQRMGVWGVELDYIYQINYLRLSVEDGDGKGGGGCVFPPSPPSLMFFLCLL